MWGGEKQSDLGDRRRVFSHPRKLKPGQGSTSYHPRYKTQSQFRKMVLPEHNDFVLQQMSTGPELLKHGGVAVMF